MKSKTINLKLFVFVFCHVLLIAGLFLFVKKEYHSDEIWSFGIANGSQAGAVFQDADMNPINNNKWMSAEVLHENLTVQKDERFQFGMPYENSVNDAHPPFSFMLIHLISSFFPDSFSFWFYIPFNILALILCDVFIYKILKLYDLPDNLCLGICSLYAFSAGGIDTMMYIRMYALLVAFSLIILYLSMKVYMEKSVTRKDAVSLICVCFLGSFTEYEFYVYAFILTVLTGLLLLLHRKVKVMFQYGICMAAGVGMSLLAFPEFFRDVFGNVNGEGFDSLITYPYGLQLSMIINMVLSDMIGVAPSVYSPFGNLFYYIGFLTYGLLICIPLIFLMRKSPKFIAAGKKLKEWITSFMKKIKMYHYVLLVCFVECIAMICIFGRLVSVYHMMNTTTRYFFIIYPTITILISLLLYCLASCFKGKISRVLYSIILIFFGVFSQVKGGHAFIGFNTLDGQNITEVRNSNIIIVNKNFGELERVAHMIDSSNSFFSIEYDDIEEYSKQLTNVPMDSEVYLVLSEGALTKHAMTDSVKSEDGNQINYEDFNYDAVKEKNEKKILEQLKQLGICSECHYMGQEKMLNTTFIYYKLER